MNAYSQWVISNAKQALFIKALTDNLPMLRAKLDISQEELAKIIGVSRQPYCAIESGIRSMSWQTYLSLIYKDTHDILKHINAFPEFLIDTFKENNSN